MKDTPVLKRHRVTRILWLLFVSAIVFVYCYYTPPILRLVIRLKPMVLALGFLLSLAGWGTVAGRALLHKVEAPVKQLSFVAFGSGLTALFVLVVGIAGEFSPLLFVCWAAGGLALFGVNARLWISLQKENRFTTTSWDFLALFTILAFLIFNLPYLISPEVSSDALAYHLLVPKLYLSTVKIHAVPL